MTDALVEAVARAIRENDGPDGCYFKEMATAALQAIEAAGYRVVPVKATRELRVVGEKEMMARHCLHSA